MSDDEARMSFTEHLGELRTRLIRSGVVFFVAVVVCFLLFSHFFDILARPLRPLQEETMIVTEITEQGERIDREMVSQDELWLVLNPLEPFLVNLRLSIYGGIAFALPFILYQICAFIFPGLKSKERNAVLILLSGCSVLGIAGALMAYFGVLPLVLPYLIAYAPEGVDFKLRMSETLFMVIKALLGFAIAFQFPMIVFILVYLDLLSPETLKKWRRVAIVGLAFFSALLTPPEPISMVLMAGPLVLLYELSIWISTAIVWRRRRAEKQAKAK